MNAINPLKGNRKIGSVGLPIPFHQIRAVIIDDNGNYVSDADKNKQRILVAHGPM